MGIELFVFVGVFVWRIDLICGRAWGAANRATREGRGGCATRDRKKKNQSRAYEQRKGRNTKEIGLIERDDEGRKGISSIGISDQEEKTRGAYTQNATEVEGEETDAKQFWAHRNDRLGFLFLLGFFD
jgi:hypothetical protein